MYKYQLCVLYIYIISRKIHVFTCSILYNNIINELKLKNRFNYGLVL